MMTLLSGAGCIRRMGEAQPANGLATRVLRRLPGAGWWVPMADAPHPDPHPPLPEDARAALLERFNAINRPLFGGHLGYRLVDARRGWARLEVENRPELTNPHGVMHGGASFGLADSAVAAALLTIYEPGNALLTIEMKINYLEPIFAGTVAAEARVIRSSRRSAYAEVDVLAGGKLAARATTTYMIKPSGT
jgi:uncharacterized protein (TIGR00369 family)